MNGRIVVSGLALAALVLNSSVVGARQQQPAPVVNTEIYLANFGEMLAHPNAPVSLVNISNSPDYDNQPSFTPDGKSILFSSKRDNTQYDIYRYDIDTKKLTQVTHTPENENSPIVTPDGKTFSVVRTEMDKTQRLWRFNLDGSNPQLVLADVKPVGYHAWIDATHVGLFVLGANRQPATLQIADTATGKADVIDSNIGRTLNIRPGSHSLMFVSKKDPIWTISEVASDRSVHTVLPLGETGTPSVEDFVWSDGQRAIFGRNNQLWGVWASPTAGQSSNMKQLVDLAPAGIAKITRLAMSPDHKYIAIVAEPVTK